MSDADIHALAIRVSEAAAVLDAFGYGNEPTDPAERVKADARYRLAQDAYNRVKRDYDDAIAKLTTEELLQLTK